MSIIDLYTAEAKFNQAKQEYTTLMRSLNYSCLGKDKSTDKCKKAAALNAEMQTYLIQISNLLVVLKPNLKHQPTIHEQQKHLLFMADHLENDKNSLATSIASKRDMSVFIDTNRYHVIAWVFSAILVFSIIVHQTENI